MRYEYIAVGEPTATARNDAALAATAREFMSRLNERGQDGWRVVHLFKAAGGNVAVMERGYPDGERVSSRNPYRLHPDPVPLVPAEEEV